MNPQIIVEYLAKTDQLGAGLKDISSQGSKTRALASKAFLPAAAALGAITVAASKAVSSASDLNEAMSATQQVFGASSADILEWSKGSAKAFGLSRSAALDAANGLGNLLLTTGLSETATAGMSKAMVQLAGDMASFSNEDPSDMLERIRAGLSGESEPLKKFGSNLSEARVKAFAYSHGIAKAGETLTEQQKVQARYGQLLEDTSRQQGDYARTATGLANTQRTNAAETENASAAFGKALLPAMTAIQQVLTKVLGFLGRYPGVLQAMVAVVALLAIGIMALNAVMAITAAVSASVLGPFLLVVAAIAALIVIGVLLWKNWDKITAALKAAWAGIVNAFHSAVAQVSAGLGRLWSAITTTVSRILGWLRSNWQTILLILSGPIGLAVVLIARYWDRITAAARAAIALLRSLWSGLSSFISGVVSSITSALGRLVTWLGKPAEAAREAASGVKSAIGKIPGYIEDIVGRVRSAASSVANAIKSPINAVLRAFNGISFTIPGFSIGGQKVGPLTVPKVSVPPRRVGGFHVPELARGGVLSSPTLFLGGEGQGREIVTPEALLREILAEQGAGGGGDTYQLVLQPRTADAGSVAYAFRRLELLRTGR